jgi:hypothetical protein
MNWKKQIENLLKGSFITFIFLIIPQISWAIVEDYIVFEKNYLEMVMPDNLPKIKEIKNEISTFASPGEYEPVSFVI